MDELKKSISNYISLSEQEMDIFCSEFTFKTLKRKEFLFQEGQVCKTVVFIRKGCLRYFYMNEGEEKTGQFFFENGWYTDYDSFLTQKPTQQFTQALEPTELWVLSKENLYKLYENNPKIERFGRIMAENAYLGSRKNNIDFLTLNPEERYLKLITERPKIMERVSLKYIASYLGIKPESLSRIRKRLFLQKQNS